MRTAPVTVADRFRTALLDGHPGSLDTELLPQRAARACVQALAVTGAGISLIQDDFRVPLGASDDVAGYAERLQFTHGEGPCLAAYDSVEPVTVDAGEIKERWPLFAADLAAHTPYRCIISLPILRTTPGSGGAIDLYLQDPAQADLVNPVEAKLVANTVAALLSISASLPRATPEPDWLNSDAASRRKRVWVAIGMVSVELDLNSTDALAVLRGQAYVHGRTLDDLAHDLVEGTLPVDRLRT